MTFFILLGWELIFRVPPIFRMIRYHQEVLLMISALQIEADARKRHKVYGLKPHIKLWLNYGVFLPSNWMVWKISFIWNFNTAVTDVTEPFCSDLHRSG